MSSQFRYIIRTFPTALISVIAQFLDNRFAVDCLFLVPQTQRNPTHQEYESIIRSGMFHVILRDTFKLTSREADFACVAGQIKILRWLVLRNIVPRQTAIDFAAGNGCLDILNLLVSLNPGFLPSNIGLRKALKDGHFNVVQWAYSHVSLRCLYGLIDDAAVSGNLDVLRWGGSRTSPPILPSQDGIDNAAERGRLKTLRWAASLSPPILPSQEGIDFAARKGQIDVIRWAALLNPPIRVSPIGVCLATVHGQIRVLKYLASLNPPVLPELADVSKIRSGKRYYAILLWLAALDSPIVANRYIRIAAPDGYLNGLKWAASLSPPILPSVAFINGAAVCDRLNILQWAASLTPPILPSQEGITAAAQEGNRDVLQWAASLSPPILPM